MTSPATGSGRGDQTLDILRRYVDRDFTVFPMGESRPVESQVRTVGDTLGVAFPDAFVDHVCGEFPGTAVLAKEDVWPRPEPLDVAPFWRFLYGVHSFSPLPAGEDWMRLDRAGPQFQTRTGHAAVPILKLMGDANVYCTDGDGRILQFDRELNALEPIELDFWALFDRETKALVDRKNRLIAERGNDK